MSNKAGNIRATPLYGGRSNTGVCVLLEFSGARILLDCGSSVPVDYSYLEKLTQDLIKAGGVDAILLSHADLHHVGALPLLAGKNGLQNIPIIATLPVGKFSSIVLYDFLSNLQMEGDNNLLHYDYDDIDSAFENLITVKYNQVIHLPETRSDGNKRETITLCAIPSGRTLGGAIWRIRCGPAEVLYTVDLNLRNETVVNGANLDSLPSTPALMITEAASVSRISAKFKDESSNLIKSVMETVRQGGNVLIPCETVGRSLEVIQLLSKYWIENKIGLYPLIFLSHMSRNVRDFSQTMLEWMNTSLTKDFYNRNENPFELANVHFLTNTNDFDRRFPGPKVVISTDSSLQYGFSKEMLLKWGGDPRCSVMFVDTPDHSSLGEELINLSKAPPIITTVFRPIKVELSGQELIDYRLAEEKKREEEAEEEQRRRRQAELSQFRVDHENDETDEESEDQEARQNKTINHSILSYSRKRFKTLNGLKALESKLVFFEKKHTTFQTDEYGVLNHDLVFQDIMDTKGLLRDKDGKFDKNSNMKTNLIIANKRTDTSLDSTIPTKLISFSNKIQFTCEFKQFNLSGRTDFKFLKTLLNHTTPSRLLVVRGSESDCDTLVEYARSLKIEVHAPKNRSYIAFQVYTERLNLLITKNNIPSNMKILKGETNSSVNGNVSSICLLSGFVSTNEIITQEGAKQFKYVSGEKKTSEEKKNEENENEINQDEYGEVNPILDIHDDIQGVVSIGEVGFDRILKHLRDNGHEAKYSSDGVLKVDDQVIIRKDQNNFSIEGPPIKAFYEARKILYQQFTFV